MGQLLLKALVSVLPIVLILWYFYTRDANREPRDVLTRTFWLGVLATLPVLGVSALLAFAEPQSMTLVLAAGYHAFLLAAVPEETAKLLIIRGFCARDIHFDEPMDGIVYGVYAALGFAAVENVVFALAFGWIVAGIRAFTALPMHAAEGAIIGYAVARARLGLARRGAVAKGLAVAMVLHGLYDFALLSISGLAQLSGTGTHGAIVGLSLLVVCLLIGAILWTLRTVRRLRARQLNGEGHTPAYHSAGDSPSDRS